ncbi:uncharacterized protein [Temnothorax nylanderi]|uniref:uncharacterized protein n=1 Tax=Temnothorax nylanderi TaxID=102681 RepID=UPI003A8921EB
MAEKRKYNPIRIQQPKLEYEGYHFHHNSTYKDTILQDCLKTQKWKQLLALDEESSFNVECVIKNNDTKAVIFIDKFLTESIMNKINEPLTMFVDGTFATVPQLKNKNCQLWTILIRYNNRTFPIVYAIMKNKNTEDYIEILKQITNTVNIKPVTIISDFERAERKALQVVFPCAKIIGCFFHYSQALVRKADKCGIIKGKEKELGWGLIKLLKCLAFLPETYIEEGFQLIHGIIFHDCKNLKPFIQYYKETWINSFKPNSFCVYGEKYRTNNVTERHNRELKENLKKHSTIVKFLGTT